MLLIAFQISLICIAVHALFWEGMILYKLGRSIKILLSAYTFTSKLQKPLFDCLICMSSFWTIISYFILFGNLDLKLIPLMLVVCGINVIWDSLIYYLRNGK